VTVQFVQISFIDSTMPYYSMYRTLYTSFGELTIRNNLKGDISP